MIRRIRAFRLIRAFIQRGRHGYAHSDLWSFDTYLAEVIAKGCRELADISHGPPGALLFREEVISMITSIAAQTTAPTLSDETQIDDSPEAVAKADAEWREILGTIAFGMEVYAENEDSTNPEFQRSLTLLAKWWGALWD